MSSLPIRALLAALALVLACGPAAAKKTALVVGINTYKKLGPTSQLKTAVNDSRGVGNALRELGFEVIEAADVDRKGFNEAWDRFMAQVTRDDTAVFYFAGHGVQIDSQNYLLPSDVPNVQEGRWELMKRESLSLAEFLNDLHGKDARLNLIILDACRDSPFGTLSRGPAMPTGLAAVEPPRGTFLMFSAASGQRALDRLRDDERAVNSVYTRRLIPLMKEPGLAVRDLALRVRREVEELAKTVGHEQNPAYRDELKGTGEYCLAGCGTATAAVAKENGGDAAQPLPQQHAKLPEPARSPAPAPPALAASCGSITLPIKTSALVTSSDRLCAIAACTSSTLDSPNLSAVKRWLDAAKIKGQRGCDIADREALGDDAVLTRLLAIAATQATTPRADERTSCLDARQALIDEINEINARLRNAPDAPARCGAKAKAAASADVTEIVDALR